MRSPERRSHQSSRRQFSEYYAPRPSQQKPPQKPNRQRRFKLSTRQISALLVLLLAIAILPFTQLNPANADVRVSSVVYRPKNAYEQAVKAELSKMLNRSFFTLDERAVSENLRKKFPEVASASVTSKPFGRAIKVKITTKTPSFIISNQSGEFIVDSSGLAVTKVISPIQTKGLIRLEDKTGFDVKAGQQVFSSQDMQFITQLTEGLRLNGTSIGRLELPAIAKQLRLYQGGVDYYIKFHTGGDAKLQLGSFLAVSKQLASEGKQPSEYIDVRVEGKVFYR